MMDDQQAAPFQFAPDVDRPPAEGGSPLRDAVLAAMQTVFDPEIPVNIVELGLIYGFEIDPSGKVEVEMTLTTPSCPVAGNMPGEVERAIRTVEGVSDVHVELVWTPPWSPQLMSEAARLELGFL